MSSPDLPPSPDAVPGPELAAEPQLEALPPYARSLLRIAVPVTVTLATSRQPISRILEMGPGSMIQFEKSCDELLELEVNGHTTAVGEAVKVGDKFGLRITAMVLPQEEFKPLGRTEPKWRQE